MIAKDMKDAKVYTIMLDKERPFTFDFNTLGLIQEFGFHNPFEILNGISGGYLNSIKIGVYSGLVSGLLIEDENTSLDISISELGRMLGYLMVHDKDHYQEILQTVLDSMKDFFPELAKDDEDEKNENSEKN